MAPRRCCTFGYWKVQHCLRFTHNSTGVSSIRSAASRCQAKFTQQLMLDAPLLPKTEAIFGVRLSGVTPEQLGFIRLHQVETSSP
ncbi:DUF3251 domain-containing protein [Candidatus Symbiopectobacterium sp.]|uniref:DUF3251 domain-containing protein n=1 Tax=Candidatus Symbiopectobacterium sp. TaxID=2816440 RepID=UPI00345D946A